MNYDIKIFSSKSRQYLFTKIGSVIYDLLFVITFAILLDLLEHDLSGIYHFFFIVGMYKIL